MKPFKRSEDFFILLNYKRIPASKIARHLRRHESSIRGRMRKLELTIPAELTKLWKSETQFKKGHVSSNKGLRQSDFLSPAQIRRMKKTQFKKGHRPQSWRPVGTEQLRGDGYVWRKISEPNKWMQKHRWLWIKKRGKILPGMMITFKDGNKLRIVISNLKMISKRANMKRNTVHNCGKEVARTVQLIGALNRQINKRIKETKQ